MIVIAISGKAESGKTYTANIMKDILDCKIIPLASTLKEQAKALGWSGEKDEKGRTFLQELGKCIKKYNGADYYAKKLIEKIGDDDFVIIDDLRLIEEIDTIKDAFENVLTIRVERPYWLNRLTEEQRKDISEVGLDFYDFDMTLTNDENYDELVKEVAENIKKGAAKEK